MKINLLKAFYFVSLEKSFTNAAKRLFLTQPAISAQVQSLEKDLGVILFERNKKSRDITLTKEGKKLLKYSESIFKLLDDMEKDFKEVKSKKQNTINIGTTTVYGVYFFPEILRVFTQKYPAVRINNYIGNSFQTLDLLKKSEIEMAVIRGNENIPDNFEQILLHSEKLVFISSSDHKLTKKTSIKFADLKEYCFILREKGSHTREQIEKWFEKHKLKNMSLMELGNIESTKKSVAEGVGISLVPKIAVQRELNDGVLVELNIQDFDLRADYYLVYIYNEDYRIPIQNLMNILNDVHEL